MITTEKTRLLSLGDATPNDWRHVVDALAPFMREKRVRTLELALSQRRNGLHLVVENVQDPLNAQTVMRTATKSFITFLCGFSVFVLVSPLS